MANRNAKPPIEYLDLTNVVDSDEEDASEIYKPGQLDNKAAQKLAALHGTWGARLQPSSTIPRQHNNGDQPTTNGHGESFASDGQSTASTISPKIGYFSTSIDGRPVPAAVPSERAPSIHQEPKHVERHGFRNNSTIQLQHVEQSKNRKIFGDGPPVLPSPKITRTPLSQVPLEQNSADILDRPSVAMHENLAQPIRGMKRDSNGEPIKPVRLVLRMSAESSPKHSPQNSSRSQSASRSQPSPTVQSSRAGTHEHNSNVSHGKPDPKPPPYDVPMDDITVARMKRPSMIHRSGTNKTWQLVAKMDAVNPTFGGPTPREEDELIIHLKEELGLSWANIGEFFLHRTSWHSAQSRYSTKLKKNRSTVVKRPPPPRPPSISPDRDEPPERRLRLQRRVDYTLPASALPSGDVMDVDDASHDFLDELRENVSVTKPRWHVKDVDDSTLGIQNISATTPQPKSRPIELLEQTLRAQRDVTAISSLTGRILRPPTVVETRKKFGGVKELRKVKRPSVEINRHYLFVKEREYLKESMQKRMWHGTHVNEWKGQIIHVDFNEEEIEIVERIIRNMRLLDTEGAPLGPNLTLQQVMQGASDQEIQHIAVKCFKSGKLLNRTLQSIESFIYDIVLGAANFESPARALSLQSTSKTTTTRLRQNILSREHGDKISRRNVEDEVQNTMGPLLSYTGTSGAVNTVAWAPNGRYFAVGSAALADPSSMQYNMPKNLLIGDVVDSKLRELPLHFIPRPKPEDGPNSTDEMYISQDPLLFKTVTTVKFMPSGEAMISAGFDEHVRIWDLRDTNEGININKLRNMSVGHKGDVDVIAVNAHNVFATGAKKPSGQVRTFKCDLDADDVEKIKLDILSSPRADQGKDLNVTPSCLIWGSHFYQQDKYLLCGFSSTKRDYGEGHMALWDVEVQKTVAEDRGNRTVFDVAWSPTEFGRFACACVSGLKLNHGMQSIVRIFDSRRLRLHEPLKVNSQRSMELECPALDANDLVFNPKDSNFVSVGCTDGSIYTWDLRNPGRVLHRFDHGGPLHPLDEQFAREVVDDGVRFLSWDSSGRKLYTGSSDGVVACWDPYVSSEDAHIRNVATFNSGVLSGEFSPDLDKLLIGEVSGRFSVLSVGQSDRTSFEEFSFDPKVSESVEKLKTKLRAQAGASLTSSDHSKRGVGQLEATRMLSSKEIELKPFGDFQRYDSQKGKKVHMMQAVQGSEYKGPYDNSLDGPMLRKTAQDHQDRLRERLNLQAHAPDSKPSASEYEFPAEEMGDSLEWRKRIPESWRFQASSCLNQAFNKDSSKKTDLFCNRCDQGQQLELRGNDILSCTQCGYTCRVDVLGYTPMKLEKRYSEGRFEDFDVVPFFGNHAEYEDAMRLGLEQLRLEEEEETEHADGHDDAGET